MRQPNDAATRCSTRSNIYIANTKVSTGTEQEARAELHKDVPRRNIRERARWRPAPEVLPLEAYAGVLLTPRKHRYARYHSLRPCTLRQQGYDMRESRRWGWGAGVVS